MPELSASTVRVDWDPASAKLVLLDWGDRVPAPLALPWEQQTADESLKPVASQGQGCTYGCTPAQQAVLAGVYTHYVPS